MCDHGDTVTQVSSSSLPQPIKPCHRTPPLPPKLQVLQQKFS